MVIRYYKTRSLERKSGWNSHRSKRSADFYTMGYSRYTVPGFLLALQDVRIATLIDIRHDAVSMHRPEFSKKNLRHLLADNGIAYVHRPDLGVPREIRNQMNHDRIWEWYDNNILQIVGNKPVELFGSARGPIALMCVEADPIDCHRHRLAIALERLGLKSYDLHN